MAIGSNLTAFLTGQIAQWNAQHPKQIIDPAAELAVAGQEGLSGRVGDNGHAFGPNQENDAGGVLTGRFPGETPEQLNEWAWSPAGVQDSLSRVAAVSANMKGAPAVANIVSRYERPQDIPGEISRADASLGAPYAPATFPADPVRQPGSSSGSSTSTGSTVNPQSALASFLISGLSLHQRPTAASLLPELQQLHAAMSS